MRPFLKLWLKVFFIVCVFVDPLSLNGSDAWQSHPLFKLPQPSWTSTLNLEEIEQRLRDEKIILLIPMREYLKTQEKTADFDNQVYLVVLESGLKGVFKPDPEHHDMYGEVAAYKASQWMNVRLVPPTVIKSYKKQKGSLQFFIATPIDSSRLESYKKMRTALDEVMCQTVDLFCFLFGQWDIGPSNILFVPSHPLLPVLIDNAGIVQQQHVRVGEAPFVRKTYCDNRNDPWTDHFPFEKAKKIMLSEIDQNTDFKKCSLTSQKFPFLKKTKNPLTYLFWRNSLWIQPYKDVPLELRKPSSSLLLKIKELNASRLQEIWKDHPKDWSSKQLNEIIRLTLERRDQLLKTLQ